MRLKLFYRKIELAVNEFFGQNRNMLGIFAQKNKKFERVLHTSHWRRLAMGSWGGQSDPSIYGVIEINVEPALCYIEKIRAETNERITITHFVGKAWGTLLKLHPEMNSTIRWGKFYKRASIDIAFQVAIDGGHTAELSAGMVRNIDQKNLAEIARDLNSAAHRIRNEGDPDYKKIKKSTNYIPSFLIRPIMNCLKIILNPLNLWSPLLGLPRDSFGSMMITNVGALGLDWCFPALFPTSNQPMLVALGAIYQHPIYETDEHKKVTHTRLENYIRMCGVFDHRYVDGLHASKMARDLRAIFAEPEKYLEKYF